MNDLIRIIYTYCTDFVISVANLSGTSYYEVNFFFFCVLYPALLVASIVVYVFQRRRYSRFMNDVGG